MFAEVSAADGRNIELAVGDMAKKLKDNFYNDLQRGKAHQQDTISLNKKKKKKGCC